MSLIEIATVTNSGNRMNIIIAAVTGTSSHAIGSLQPAVHVATLSEFRSSRRTETMLTASTMATSTVATVAPNGQS